MRMIQVILKETKMGIRCNKCIVRWLCHYVNIITQTKTVQPTTHLGSMVEPIAHGPQTCPACCYTEYCRQLNTVANICVSKHGQGTGKIRTQTKTVHLPWMEAAGLEAAMGEWVSEWLSAQAPDVTKHHWRLYKPWTLRLHSSCVCFMS